MINILVARRFQAFRLESVPLLPVPVWGFSQVHWFPPTVQSSLVITDSSHSQKTSLPQVSAVIGVAERVLQKAALLFICPNSGSVRLSHFSVSPFLIMSS